MQEWEITMTELMEKFLSYFRSQSDSQRLHSFRMLQAFENDETVGFIAHVTFNKKEYLVSVIPTDLDA